MSLCILADLRFRLVRGGWIFPANVDVNALPKVGLAVGKQGEDVLYHSQGFGVFAFHTRVRSPSSRQFNS